MYQKQQEGLSNYLAVDLDRTNHPLIAVQSIIARVGNEKNQPSSNCYRYTLSVHCTSLIMWSLVIDYHISQYSRASIIRISIIRTLNYPNSSSDCSNRVFCQQVYVLLEYFSKVYVPLKQFNGALYTNQWASFIRTNSLI